MNQVFGEGAKALNAELQDYAYKSKIQYMRLPFKKIELEPITIRAVSPAEDALMWEEIALGRGIFNREAAAFAEDVRKKAARYPDDPYALLRLVEAERAAGNDQAATEAVERLLTVKPGHPRGLAYKGMLQVNALQAAKSADQAAWKAARALLVEAHKAAEDDAFILEAYYDSFTAQGVTPPAGAQNALYRAFELVPQDGDLRYKLALDFEQRGMVPEALAIIKPAAFQLHAEDETDPRKKKKQEELEEKYREAGKAKRETAREMYDRLEKKLAERGKAGG